MAKFAANSHIGRVYGHNEDSVRCEPSKGLFLVADGMGGHASGEVASRIVADTVARHGANGPLADAVLAGHRAVVDAASANVSRSGMGSTVVVARISGGRLEIAWVGDSRGYLFRDHRLERITKDHSLVNLLLERNELSEAEAYRHPQKNVITQTLGHGEPVPSHSSLALRCGDRVLLCSDGLNDELTDGEIGELLAIGSLEQAVDSLVEKALARGGRDNISAVLIEAERADALARWRVWADRPWWPAAVGIGAAVVVAVFVLGARAIGWL